MALVLVTGGTGYAGSSVVHQLLKKGYKVRLAVRNSTKADQFAAKYKQYKDQLEFVNADLGDAKSWEAAVKGVTGVFHLAAPMIAEVKTTVKDDFLEPAIQGITRLLEAAAKTPTVKRIVITSSMASLIDMTKGSDYVYTDKDWNPITYEFAANSGSTMMGYFAAKTLSEKAAFDFVKEKKPSFDVVSLTPPFIMGPTDQAIESSDDLTSSPVKVFEHLFTNKKEAEPASPFSIFIDVRDLAVANVLAFETPAASNQRYPMSTGAFSFQQIADKAHKLFPGQTSAPQAPATPAPQPPCVQLDSIKAEKELGYRPTKLVDEMVRDSIAQLVALKKDGKLEKRA